MSFVLFVLGLAAAAAGVLAIGFGIPINEFSLGNTLILAGTTGLSSGLIVLALAVAARQLKKIADLLSSRPAGPGRSSEGLEPPPGGGRGGLSRSLLPGGGGDAPARGPAYSERPQRGAPTDMADDPDFEPQHFDPPFQPPGRPATAPRNSGPSGFDPIEDVPLSPRTQPRIPATGAPPAGGWRPPGARLPAPPSAEPVRQEPSIGAPARPAPDVAFDSIWPSDRRAERVDPQPDPVAAPAPRPNGAAIHRDPPPPPAARAPDNAPVTVLKSGVVDGMAYTLYTDGSIEAELAQGVVRFGSIEELRNHLEKGA